MSIAVVVKKNKKIALGADTLQTFGANKACDGNMIESKCRKIGTAYLATTSWGLYDDILEDYLKTQKSIRLNSRHNVFVFFLNLWPALHEKYAFVNDQCNEKESPFGDLDAAFLIATKKNIFQVSSNMSVTEFHKFHAIGSGCDFAIGAMFAVYEQDLTAAEIAKIGLEAAMAHNVYCGGETEIIEL